jgi:hypothetical protein
MANQHMAAKKLNLIEICSVQGEFKANVIKSRLESDGIPVLLKYESLGIILGITVDGLGQVRVMVPAHLAEEAKQIINTD